MPAAAAETRRGGLSARPTGRPDRAALHVLVVISVAFAALVAMLGAADVNDWPSHDHDAGGQRYSPLKQITPANVATLQRAWTFDTGVNGLQVTPLVVNGVMYVTAGQDV